MKKSIFLTVFILIYSFISQAGAVALICPKPVQDNEKNKNIAITYFRMGLAFQKNGKKLKFLQAFKCVLTLVPYSVSAMYRYAQALDQLGQYSQAVIQYKLVIANIKDKAYIFKIKTRISEIKGKKDLPLPKDESEKTSSDIKKQKIIEARKLNKLHQKELSELRARIRNKEEFEKKKQLLEKKYRAEVNQRMADYEKRIKKLARLEKLAKKPKVIIKYVSKGIQFKKVHTTMRKVGMGTASAGVLLGIGAIVTVLMSNSYVTDYNDQVVYVNKNNNDDPKSFKRYSSSNLEAIYHNYTTTKYLSIGLGIAAGIFSASGVVMYMLGKTYKVRVKGDIDWNSDEVKNSSKTSWQLVPSILPNGAGLSMKLKW